MIPILGEWSRGAQYCAALCCFERKILYDPRTRFIDRERAEKTDSVCPCLLFLVHLLQALYNVVDMLVVGKIVGKTGFGRHQQRLHAVLLSSIPFAFGLTMGGSVLVAQCKGANDQTGQRDTIGMLFFLSLVGSAVVTILGLAIMRPSFRRKCTGRMLIRMPAAT